MKKTAFFILLSFLLSAPLLAKASCGVVPLEDPDFCSKYLTIARCNTASHMPIFKSWAYSWSGVQIYKKIKAYSSSGLGYACSTNVQKDVAPDECMHSYYCYAKGYYLDKDGKQIPCEGNKGNPCEDFGSDFP